MNKLPETDSIKALAEFWQTHDVTDFEDALIEVTEPVFQRAEPLSVILPAADLAALRARARQVHTPETALVSRWIHERLDAG
ncbi:CopG family antitoxin [Lamprocystis purpurea]|uniref:CopG family antitoxin n=1 Tax=Lamprocystis purpurea TaxID=61598 RepID=UPI000590BFE4|nr:CopG family antitoxin [Lamprocystis purpurea]